MATLDEFRTEFPEFASTEDAVISKFLGEAKLIHNVRKLATLLCAAHLVVIDQQRSDGADKTGEVSSSSVGSMSVDYVTQAREGPEAFFTSTSYGSRFLTLEKRAARTAIGAMVVG